MARPSKLTPDQWREVEKRSAAGEGARSIAKDFGVDEAAIRRRVSPQTPQVQRVAQQLAAAQTALATLPVPHQHLAINLADELRAVSQHLASAAKFGAATAHRLAGIAHGKVAEIDDAAPLTDESIDALKGVAVLTRMANEAASTGLNLLAANKDRIRRLEDGENEGGNDDDARRETLARKLEEEDGAPAS